MIVAIPVDDNKTDICVSFGRAPYFLFVNTDTDEINTKENPGANAESGAGLKTAQFVIDNNAEAIITIRCGENSAEVLKEAEINIFKAESNNAKTDFESFKKGNLAPLTKFTAGFHGKV